jgi:hypothetical protein
VFDKDAVSLTVIIALSVILVLLMVCAGAIAYSYRQRLLRLETQLGKRIEPEQLVIISDPGADLDDEVTRI